MVRQLSNALQLIVNGKPVERATFTITREMIEKTSLPGNVPDHKWFFIDASGHYHAFNAEGELPTLDAKYVDVRSFGDDPDDDYEIFAGWHCQICGALIEPKYKPDPTNGFAAFEPGRMEWGGEFESAQTFNPGEQVSIRIPEMRRFGIAMITAKRASGGGESFEWTYSYTGIGELAERAK